MIGTSVDVESRVRRYLDDVLDPCPDSSRERVVQRVVELVRLEHSRERDRSVKLCLQRVELWRTTLSSLPSSPELARNEARSRANEAQYLADLVDSNSEPFPEADE